MVELKEAGPRFRKDVQVGDSATWEQGGEEFVAQVHPDPEGYMAAGENDDPDQEYVAVVLYVVEEDDDGEEKDTQVGSVGSIDSLDPGYLSSVAQELADEYQSAGGVLKAEGGDELGSLPRSQAQVHDAYNRALEDGAADKGDSKLEFRVEEEWLNTVGVLGLDVEGDESSYTATNGREQLGAWQGGKGHIDFARIFAILDESGITENKEKHMSKQLKEGDGELDVVIDEIALYALENHKPGLAEFLDLDDETMDTLHAMLKAKQGMTAEAVTTPGVVISRNMMIRVFKKGTNELVDRGLVTQTSPASVFLGTEEYAKNGYDFLIIG